MAYTKLQYTQSGSLGNLINNTLYYWEDKERVRLQANMDSVGLINRKFRDRDVTVFAAKDANGDVLEILALPCPPYYHDNMPGAGAGNLLT